VLSTRRTRALSASVAVLAATAFVLIGALPASAAGVGDLSAAVLYEATSPIGTILEDLDDGDDSEQIVALPFSVNYNGIVATALCVTTNGYVVPVATLTSDCDSGAYDQSLIEGAQDIQQSTIGVLLHDIDTANRQWAGPGVGLVSFDLTAGVATFTTAAAHGYAPGDLADLWFSTPDPDLGPGGQATVDTVPDATTFTVLVTRPDIASHLVSGQTRTRINDVDDDTNADGHADDGFGALNQIYAGATSVGGKPAFAVTWYRVTSYNDFNSPTLSDTFQIVIVQDTTANGATVGYNFTVHFNFGTVADNDLEDGYDATDPSDECDDAAPQNCRFAVGFSFYDAATDTATSQELFASVPKANLIDGGSQSLVTNSLDSGVAGRYILRYVGPSQLAATGSESVPLGFAALALLAAGGVLMVVRRRTSVAR
jgi:LPXTG-motif cell wall-anchored protein